jgi:hypothetical protein
MCMRAFYVCVCACRSIYSIQFIIFNWKLNGPDANYKVSTGKEEEEKVQKWENFYNWIQFFITYVPSQQLQSQLQKQHSVDTGNYIQDKQHKSNSHI